MKKTKTRKEKAAEKYANPHRVVHYNNNESNRILDLENAWLDGHAQGTRDAVAAVKEALDTAPVLADTVVSAIRRRAKS